MNTDEYNKQTVIIVEQLTSIIARNVKNKEIRSISVSWKQLSTAYDCDNRIDVVPEIKIQWYPKLD